MERFEFSVRASRVLDRMGISQDDLTPLGNMTVAEAMRWPNCGRLTITEFAAALLAAGFDLDEINFGNGLPGAVSLGRFQSVDDHMAKIRTRKRSAKEALRKGRAVQKIKALDDKLDRMERRNRRAKSNLREEIRKLREIIEGR